MAYSSPDVPEFDGQELLDFFSWLQNGIPVHAQTDTSLSTPIPDLHWKPPLHPKCQGPYEVLSQTRNTVWLKMGNDIKLDNIS